MVTWLSFVGEYANMYSMGIDLVLAYHQTIVARRAALSPK
jgi:hypothetical protein